MQFITFSSSFFYALASLYYLFLLLSTLLCFDCAIDFFSCIIRSFGLCQFVFVGIMFIVNSDLCDLGFKAFSCFVNGCYVVLCFFFFLSLLVVM